MLVLITTLFVLATRHTARNGIDGAVKLRIEPTIEDTPHKADLPREGADLPREGTDAVTILTLGDVARCKPENLYGYLRIGLHYLRHSHIASYGKAKGAAQTAKLVAQFPNAEILGLGDLVYPHGSLFSYKYCFAKYFGAAFDRIHPVPGNHDYKRSAAIGYFDYWGKRAGPRDKGYYSIDRGEWHIIALNSELITDAFRAQMEWLKDDLLKTSKPCILAFFHRPPFSTRERSGDWIARKLFELLHAHGTTIVLTGHNHFYERTAPLDPTGAIQKDRGVRVFVVGTGGGKMHNYAGTPAPFTEALVTGVWGALKLDLSENGYRWTFMTAPAGEVRDRGTGACVDRDLLTPVVMQAADRETR